MLEHFLHRHASFHCHWYSKCCAIGHTLTALRMQMYRRCDTKNSCLCSIIWIERSERKIASIHNQFWYKFMQMDNANTHLFRELDSVQKFQRKLNICSNDSEINAHVIGRKLFVFCYFVIYQVKLNWSKLNYCFSVGESNLFARFVWKST